MNNSSVLLDIDTRGVASVTLSQPEKHNAFDDSVIARLREIFDQLAARKDVRVLLLCSRGKNFSAGADLQWMKRMAGYSHEDNLEDARMLAGMLKALYDLPQLTIARVQGAAFGGAVGLVSCCDIAVAEEAASFCLSEVKIGLIPATISPYVVRAIGERAARRYFTTAEHFSANRAQHLGLVSEIVNTQEMDATLEGIINTILRNGPVAVRAAKQLVNEVSNSSINATLIEKTCDSIASIRVSDEGQEGLDAFLNKRQPAWIGE